MKLEFITNACAIYESQGFKLLADPWLTEGAFEGSWFHDPPIKTKPEDVLGVNALYISHIHPDHCDPDTLKHFVSQKPDIPIVVLKDKYGFLINHLTRMGFGNLVQFDHGETRDFGPFRLTMFEPFTKHPHHECEIGNILDTALLIEADDQSVLNTNDNTPSVEAAIRLAHDYPRIDIAQLNYNAAGPYPACFDNLSRDRKKSEHYKVISRHLLHMLHVSWALGARLVMPFAGAYKLGNGREHMNSYLGTTSPQNAATYLEIFGVDTLVLEENEIFDLDYLRLTDLNEG